MQRYKEEDQEEEKYCEKYCEEERVKSGSEKYCEEEKYCNCTVSPQRIIDVPVKTFTVQYNRKKSFSPVIQIISPQLKETRVFFPRL